MTFGTIVADPPWEYQQTTRHAKLSGYSDVEYRPISSSELKSLPVGKLAGKNSVLLLWTTFPFISDALETVSAWGFRYVTGLPWVKVTKSNPEVPNYGVGYWFRGAAELLLVGKRGAAYRTNHVGLISENFRHSRKPDSVYDLVETGDAPFPGPYLELFARNPREGWTQWGNEAKDNPIGEDISVTMERYLKKASQ